MFKSAVQRETRIYRFTWRQNDCRKRLQKHISSGNQFFCYFILSFVAILIALVASFLPQRMNYRKLQTEDSPEECPHNSPEERPEDSPEDHLKDAPKEWLKDSPEERLKESPAEWLKESPEEGPDDSLKESSKDFPMRFYLDFPFQFKKRIYHKYYGEMFNDSSANQ